MKKMFFLPIAALILGCNNSGTQNNNAGADSVMNDTIATTQVDEDAKRFIDEALNSGAMEVELGKLAQAQASNSRVKAFGAMMVEDHTAAGDELKALAAAKNMMSIQVMESGHIDEIADLKKENGVDFDKKYIKMMLSMHRKDIDKFEDMAKEDDQPDLKAFAAKNLPKLKMHLDSAKAINKQVKGSSDPTDN